MSAGDFELVAGRNCCKPLRTGRAVALVDAAAYFKALDAALRNARHQVLIAAWDIHAFTRLRPDTTDEADESLRDLLQRLATDRPELRICILLWDFTVLYATDRLPLPKALLDWSLPANVELRLDNRVPTGGSHHQKIVVIDDGIGFVGGIDLTEGRWDTRTHTATNSARKTALGNPYPPFHDVQLAVDGAAAAALGDVVRDRWHGLTGLRLEPPDTDDDPWPADLEPAWRDVRLGIARTLPPLGDQPAVQEVLHAYLDAIASAREHIYIENQYLTSDGIGEALASRLEEEDGPEVVLVTQSSTHSWLEESTMGVRRERFLRRLETADRHGHLRVYTPSVPGLDRDEFKLHSKIMVVDDRLVQIGSSNLNNRSMGFDSECDAVLFCVSAAEKRAALDFRNGLLAEHLGRESADIAAAVERQASLIGAIESLRDDGRSLIELERSSSPAAPSELLAELADMERPLAPADILDRLAPNWELPAVGGWHWGWKLGSTLAVLLLLALAWRYTGLSALMDPDVAAEWLAGVPKGPIGILLGVLAFVVGGLAVFPVTVMIIASALTFGLWSGLLTATLGTYLSACVTFAVGRSVGRKPLERFSSQTASKLSRQLARNGIIAVAFFRVVPVAPFTLVNMVAGASSISFRDFALGTVLGMTPGIVLLVVMGGRFTALLRNPSPAQIALFIGAVALWLGIGYLLQMAARRLERKRLGPQAASDYGD